MSRADFVVICRALVLWPAPLPLCCGSGVHAFLGLELGWALARHFGICCGSQGCCPGLTGQLCDRAAVPDGRCTFTASSLAAAGVVHALLGLVCGRLKPGGWRRCVRGAFGDLCLGRPYTSRVWRALRMGAAGSQTCGGGGGGYAAVWHERDPRGGGTLTRCATGDVRVLPRVCVFACGFSKSRGASPGALDRPPNSIPAAPRAGPGGNGGGLSTGGFPLGMGPGPGPSMRQEGPLRWAQPGACQGTSPPLPPQPPERAAATGRADRARRLTGDWLGWAPRRYEAAPPPPPTPTTAPALLRPAVAPLRLATSHSCLWHVDREDEDEDEAGGEGAGTRPRPPRCPGTGDGTMALRAALVVQPGHPGVPRPPPAPGMGRHRRCPAPPRGDLPDPPHSDCATSNARPGWGLRTASFLGRALGAPGEGHLGCTSRGGGHLGSPGHPARQILPPKGAPRSLGTRRTPSPKPRGTPPAGVMSWWAWGGGQIPCMPRWRTASPPSRPSTGSSGTTPRDTWRATELPPNWWGGGPQLRP